MKTQSQFHIVGTVTHIGETQTFASGFAKRQLVIETSPNPDQWTRPIAVQLVKDKIAIGDTLAAGATVDIEGFIDGRQWAKDAQSPVRYFTDLTVRSLLVISEDGKPAQESAQPPAQQEAAPEDDLGMPF